MMESNNVDGLQGLGRDRPQSESPRCSKRPRKEEDSQLGKKQLEAIFRQAAESRFQETCMGVSQQFFKRFRLPAHRTEAMKLLKLHPEWATKTLSGGLRGTEEYPLTYMLDLRPTLSQFEEIYNLNPDALSTTGFRLLPLYQACKFGAEPGVIKFIADKCPESASEHFFNSDKQCVLPIEELVLRLQDQEVLAEDISAVLRANPEGVVQDDSFAVRFTGAIRLSCLEIAAQGRYCTEEIMDAIVAAYMSLEGLQHLWLFLGYNQRFCYRHKPLNSKGIAAVIKLLPKLNDLSIKLNSSEPLIRQLLESLRTNRTIDHLHLVVGRHFESKSKNRLSSYSKMLRRFLRASSTAVETLKLTSENRPKAKDDWFFLMLEMEDQPPIFAQVLKMCNFSLGNSKHFSNCLVGTKLPPKVKLTNLKIGHWIQSSLAIGTVPSIRHLTIDAKGSALHLKSFADQIATMSSLEYLQLRFHKLVDVTEMASSLLKANTIQELILCDGVTVDLVLLHGPFKRNTSLTRLSTTKNARKEEVDTIEDVLVTNASLQNIHLGCKEVKTTEIRFRAAVNSYGRMAARNPATTMNDFCTLLSKVDSESTKMITMDDKMELSVLYLLLRDCGSRIRAWSTI